VIKTLNVLLKSGRTVFKFMVQIKNIVKILINVINEDEIEIASKLEIDIPSFHSSLSSIQPFHILPIYLGEMDNLDNLLLHRV
jgi:hypothetical protein